MVGRFIRERINCIWLCIFRNWQTSYSHPPWNRIRYSISISTWDLSSFHLFPAWGYAFPTSYTFANGETDATK